MFVIKVRNFAITKLMVGSKKRSYYVLNKEYYKLRSTYINVGKGKKMYNVHKKEK